MSGIRRTHHVASVDRDARSWIRAYGFPGPEFPQRGLHPIRVPLESWSLPPWGGRVRPTAQRRLLPSPAEALWKARGTSAGNLYEGLYLLVGRPYLLLCGHYCPSPYVSIPTTFAFIYPRR